MVRMSARQIGRFLKMSAPAVNKLLRDLGFLDGQPGAYSLTEKGLDHGGEEVDHTNGYGGHALRNWTTRSWPAGIIALLTNWNASDYDWYCDECNTLLNDHSGFDDVTSTWECDDCGYENDIGPDYFRKSK